MPGLSRKREIGYFRARVFALHARPPDGGSSASRVPTAPANGLFAGVDLPLPLAGELRDRVGLAFAFYLPSDLVARARVVAPERPQFPLLADRAQSVTLRAGLSVDLGFGLRAGVGVATLAATWAWITWRRWIVVPPLVTALAIWLVASAGG